MHAWQLDNNHVIGSNVANNCASPGLVCRAKQKRIGLRPLVEGAATFTGPVTIPQPEAGPVKLLVAS